MKVAVLGVGLIGGSIGLAAKEYVEDVEVVGFGRSPGRLERAYELEAIDRVAESLEQALDGADLCFCCAPVGALGEQIAAALAVAGDGCVVTDVGSIKGSVVEGVTDRRFVGGHPIAGAETAGVEHARFDLFQGATWYLTPTAESSGVLFERLTRFVAAIGAQPVAIDAESHDRLLATVSHLPHVLANALVTQVGALGDEGTAVPRVGPSFRDATRVAGANSAIWTDIYVANREAIAAEVDKTVDQLREAATLLRAGDAEAITAWNEHAASVRRGLVKDALGGGSVHELRLTVPNRPGIVAEVALALGKAGVNISDMVLAPAADLRSGAITLWIVEDAPELWIEGKSAALRAHELIEDLGFPVAEA